MRALGSPADLVSNIGGGAKALVYAPAQGLVQGPAEFFEGVGRGAQSFVKGEKCVSVSVSGFRFFTGKREVRVLVVVGDVGNVVGDDDWGRQLTLSLLQVLVGVCGRNVEYGRETEKRDGKRL